MVVSLKMKIGVERRGPMKKLLLVVCVVVAIALLMSLGGCWSP